MSRWWADADQARGNLKLVDGSDVAQGVGTTALAYHALVREQLAPLADQTLVDHAQISKAYDEVDLLPVAVALAKATRPEVGEAICDSYAVMLVQKWHDDARLATEAAVRMMSAAGVPMPQVVRRAAEVAGIPSGAAATFVSKASAVQMMPDTLADTADRVVMTWASMVGQEEASADEDISKATRRRQRSADDDFDESQVNRDAEGRFATQDAETMRAEREKRGLREQRAQRQQRAERQQRSQQQQRLSLREMARRRAELQAQTEERKKTAGKTRVQSNRLQSNRLQNTKVQGTKAGPPQRPKEGPHDGDWEGQKTEGTFHKLIPLSLAMEARIRTDDHEATVFSIDDLVTDGQPWMKTREEEPPLIVGQRVGHAFIGSGVPIAEDYIDTHGVGHMVVLRDGMKFQVRRIKPNHVNGPIVYLDLLDSPEFGKADFDPEEHPRAQSDGRFIRVRTRSAETEVETEADPRTALRAQRAERALRQQRAQAMDRATAAQRAQRLQTTTATREQVSRVQATRLQTNRLAQTRTQSFRIAHPIRPKGGPETDTTGFLNHDKELAMLLEHQVDSLFNPYAKPSPIGTVDGMEVHAVLAHPPDPETGAYEVGRVNTGRASHIMSRMLDRWSPRVVHQYSHREDAEENLDTDVKKWKDSNQVGGVAPLILRNRITGTYDTTAVIDQIGYALVGDQETMLAFESGRYEHLAFVPGPVLKEPQDFLNEDADESDWGDLADGMPEVQIWQVLDTGQLD